MATAEEQVAFFGRTLKEGERVLAPSRRPDGTLRKPVRFRAGYFPQDEVAAYKSKGALLREAMPEVPPGYDPELDAKPKTKSAKRNERKKEKKQQQETTTATSPSPTLKRGFYMESSVASSTSHKVKNVDIQEVGERCLAGEHSQLRDTDVLANQINALDLSNQVVNCALTNSLENPQSGGSGTDLDKRIRALKKKIRLAEAQQKAASERELGPEQLEKLSKLDGWRNEVAELEERKASSVS